MHGNAPTIKKILTLHPFSSKQRAFWNCCHAHTLSGNSLDEQLQDIYVELQNPTSEKERPLMALLLLIGISFHKQPKNLQSPMHVRFTWSSSLSSFGIYRQINLGFTNQYLYMVRPKYLKLTNHNHMSTLIYKYVLSIDHFPMVLTEDERFEREFKFWREQYWPKIHSMEAFQIEQSKGWKRRYFLC